MDFLLRDPVRSILLHGAGVSVVIPAPERYDVHRLIVAGRRPRDAGGRAKADKDLRQAGMLIDALQSTGGGADLDDAFREAWSRGPSWKGALAHGIEAIPKEYKPAVDRIYGTTPTL